MAVHSGSIQTRSPLRSRVQVARALLDDFLTATGVVGAAAPRRYLWTDAFAVCTLLELHGRGEEPDDPGAPDYRESALRLVDQVHHVLGRHRDDDPRRGWLSGLEGAEAEAHPTAGGLRIGKPLPERVPGEAPDPRLEWERDGQYFHYLTRWMHALLRVAEVEGEDRFLVQALELARAAHRGFVRGEPGTAERRIAWKMSIDLERPLVPTSGQHDPLDGYVTFRTLAAAAESRDGLGHGLDDEIDEMADLAGIGRGGGWATDDPLGLGGLMIDAWSVAQLRRRGEDDLGPLEDSLVSAAVVGLRAVLRSRILERPPATRLPFREIGLALGCHALGRLDAIPAPPLTALARHVEETWTDEGNRRLDVWTDHADINAVMLATSLVPDGYLTV